MNFLNIVQAPLKLEGEVLPIQMRGFPQNFFETNRANLATDTEVRLERSYLYP